MTRTDKAEALRAYREAKRAYAEYIDTIGEESPLKALRIAQNSTQFKQMQQAKIVCRMLGVII